MGNFVKKTDFDDKVKNINRKITSGKTKHVGGEKKLKELSESELNYYQQKVIIFC